MTSKRVALVTGCSDGGIGFYVCQKLAERDFVVYATSRSLSSTEGLQHPNIKRLELDVRNDTQVSSVVSTVIAESGQIDLLINNAGVISAGPLVEWTAEQAKDVYDTNVFSIIRVCGAVVPHMAKRKTGTIVNMGSVVGEIPTPWTGIYDSSKAAVRSLTDTLFMECKPLNIRVMLAAPGTIKSKLADKQDDFELVSGSLYTSFFHNIRQRMEASRDNKTMSTDVFAGKLVAQALKPHPPRYFSIGGYVSTYRLLSWLPRGFGLWMFWRMFSQPRK
ncbi:NAD-binding protein [Favolaschia claudopus]|uniref:NAD-binding protein n=1 Tax=Favolaschia claudopus TaxID=2862362 RepID=A0AAW0CSZ1_9AGAR